jgi:hypothetical protein
MGFFFSSRQLARRVHLYGRWFAACELTVPSNLPSVTIRKDDAFHRVPKTRISPVLPRRWNREARAAHKGAALFTKTKKTRSTVWSIIIL